ncbi:hypothetical protein GYMLUDRAFT_237805 [Collybiopsis luxurians FD-317 M1]|nr:hypothetical protein GYMLUDRAFT_237805 [Collybiopsis luxurians FD-317 M1]
MSSVVNTHLPNDSGAEHKALLPSPNKPQLSGSEYTFAVGILGCLVARYAFCGPLWARNNNDSGNHAVTGTGVPNANALASPDAGSSEVHSFPPISPTNTFPSMFPTDVGYAGETPTGAEAALIATPEYPIHTGAAQLVKPSRLGGAKKSKAKRQRKGKDEEWDLFKYWGHLLPWYSNEWGAFGLDSNPEMPDTCRVTGLHFLHRHVGKHKAGPAADNWTASTGPAAFASRLHEAVDNWTAKGDLAFMNNWTYKLGEEILTPFGRQKVFDLGISMRLKYGYLLKNFTETNTIPVFHTGTIDRMLHSALNFAIGFFGYPFEDQYEQSITIEAPGFKGSIAPFATCSNVNKPVIAKRGSWYVQRWAAIYLNQTRERLQSQVDEYELTIADVFAMQHLCAYEQSVTPNSVDCSRERNGKVSIMPLTWSSGTTGLGSPVARVQGAGWVQELLARLEHKRMEPHEHRFSTNSTLNDNPITFPVNQSLYVDVMHEIVLLNILTALNLSMLAANGPLPYDYIPDNQTWKVSQLAPFAPNVQFQLLECSSPLISPGQQIRIIINDAPVPLTGIQGCPEQEDGMCPVDTFVKAQREILDWTSWEWDCLRYYADMLGEGPAWETVTGDAPKPRK